MERCFWPPLLSIWPRCFSFFSAAVSSSCSCQTEFDSRHTEVMHNSALSSSCCYQTEVRQHGSGKSLTIVYNLPDEEVTFVRFSVMLLASCSDSIVFRQVEASVTETGITTSDEHPTNTSNSYRSFSIAQKDLRRMASPRNGGSRICRVIAVISKAAMSHHVSRANSPCQSRAGSHHCSRAGSSVFQPC